MSPKIQDIELVAKLDYDWGQFKNKTVFISGGTGLIGSFLIGVLQYRNERYGDNINMIACSRSKEGSYGNVRYIKHDIVNPLECDCGADFVLHLASNTHPVQYAADPVGTVTTNVFGAYNLLKFAADNKARFLLASSVEIYGEGNGSPMSEDYCGYIDCNTARAGYNESKRVSESLCQSFIQQYKIDCVIARLARVIGVDERNDSKAVAQFMRNAVNKQDIVLKSEGRQQYSFVYVADAVSGIIKVLTDGVTGAAYNIAADYDGRTLGDIAEYIANISGVKVVYDLTGQAGSSKSSYAVLNCDKIKALGWKPCFDIPSALKRIYDNTEKER